MATAWVLNLDADLELAAGEGYVASARVVTLMAPHVERARALLGQEDLLLPRADAPGWVGRAWCPTPSAIAVMRACGVEPEPHPPFDVLRRVNSRAFSASLGTTFGVFATDLDTAIAAIAPNTRLKRNFGMAGRGHRVVDRVDAGTLAYLRGGMREGGVMIEPNVKIVAEYGLHGYLSPTGALTVGRLVRQRCDVHGQWLETELADSGPADLTIDITTVAEALHGAGYFGPFGIDAFIHEHGVQARSEINARYSMGYAVGFTKM